MKSTKLANFVSGMQMDCISLLNLSIYELKIFYRFFNDIDLFNADYLKSLITQAGSGTYFGL
jgi:hypothetical protein